MSAVAADFKLWDIIVSGNSFAIRSKTDIKLFELGTVAILQLETKGSETGGGGRVLLPMRCGWLFVYAAVLFALIGSLNFFTPDDRQYSGLAESFLAGKLYLLSIPPAGADTAPFEGHYYSALGPFPALVITPLVRAEIYHQALLSFAASLAVFYLCFRLARKFEYSLGEACLFALAFCFGTSFVGVSALAGSNFLAHVLCVALLFLAISEYQGQSRWWLIGLLIGFAMATRAPAGLNILFFVLVVLLSDNSVRSRAGTLLKLLLPFAVVVTLLALYNFARFGNPFESGYGYQLNGYGAPYALWNVPGNTPGPPLDLRNIPSHLWIFLFGLPSINAIGTSVLLISPYLVYLCSIRRWDLVNRLIVVDVTAVLCLVLAFRSTGFEQMGYRFSLDFLPFVFWLLMRSRVTLTPGFRSLIFAATVISVGLTLFYLATGVDRRRNDVVSDILPREVQLYRRV